jgi:hypothetical protein
VSDTRAPTDTVESPADVSTPPSTTEADDESPSTPPPSAVPPYESGTYSQVGNWLCHPDVDDRCDVSADVSEVAADGSVTVKPSSWTSRPGAGTETGAPDDAVESGLPPLDCFYVYPTTSEDADLVSDLQPGLEALAAAGHVGPFSGLCRIFAPMYRSVTLAGLNGGFNGTTSVADITVAWVQAGDDVQDAWRHYLANWNEGRGVILVGHSQGSAHLTRLLDEVLDVDAAQRRVLAAAYLMGGSIAVPDDADVGGLLTNIPMCRELGQLGCVVSYASFDSTSPAPPDSLFGRPAPFFQPTTDGDVAGCVNPADLGGPGDAPVPLVTRFPAGQWRGVPVDTAFVDVPGALVAQCVVRDGLSYLEVTVDRSNPQIDNLPIVTESARWGLHSIDVALGAGSLIDVATAQAEAWRVQNES